MGLPMGTFSSDKVEEKIVGGLEMSRGASDFA
jgi:hypothetical protein